MRNVFRAVLLISMVAIFVLSVVPPYWRPVTGVPHVVEHLVIFAVAGAALALSFSSSRLALVVVAFAAFVEVIQLAVPGRHARISDFAVDTLGAWLGLALAVGVGALARRIARAPP